MTSSHMADDNNEEQTSRQGPKRADEPIPAPLGIHFALKRTMLLDGGLATHLESLGEDLSGELWSARLLFESPDVIRRAHLDYLRAGADCIISASYQASVQGYVRAGFTPTTARALIRSSVELALSAREEFSRESPRRRGLPRPLVAASVGPYGAFLADGSEYSGNYDITANKLLDFHRERFGLLANSPADLLAIETIASRSPVAVGINSMLKTVSGRSK